MLWRRTENSLRRGGKSLREKETGFLGGLTKEKMERVRGRDIRVLREESLA